MVDNDIKELSILEKDNYEKNINLNKIYNKNYLEKRMKETYP